MRSLVKGYRGLWHDPWRDVQMLLMCLADYQTPNVSVPLPSEWP